MSSAIAAAHGVLLSLLLHSLPAAAQSQFPPSNPRPDPYQYRLNGSMAVIIVILIAALFFIAFFSVYVRHCHDSHSDTRPPRAPVRPLGLDPSLISTFPTLIYSDVKAHKIGKNALECAVCLSEFEDDETLRLIPKCDHVFHPECIDAWLESHSTCPVCRADLNRTQLGESDHRVAESNPEALTELDRVADVEAGSNDVVLVSGEKELNPDATRGSRSNGLRWIFPRSHSTGHSFVQPGEDTERFTLRLPVEIRKQVVNRKLNRATSLVVFGRQCSSVRGYRFGSGEGSSRGKYFRTSKSDRWVFSITPRFFTRMSSMKTTPRGGSNRGEASLGSGPELEPGNSTTDSSRLPV